MLVGCAADRSEGARASLRQNTVALEVSGRSAAPIGGDGPTTYRLAWVRGAQRDEIAIDAVAWAERGAHVLVLTRDGTLTRVGHDLQHEVVDVDVASAPVTAPGNPERVAWACRTGELKVLDGEHMTTRAQGLLSAGALRFAPDGEALLFVNARNGGVAGLFVADANGTRCLTNCALRVGQPFDDYVPPPMSADSLRFSGDEVEWSTGDGTLSRVRWR